MRQQLQGCCQGARPVDGLQLPHQQHKPSQLLVLLHVALPLRRPLLSGGQAAFLGQKVCWVVIRRIILQHGHPGAKPLQDAAGSAAAALNQPHKATCLTSHKPGLAWPLLMQTDGSRSDNTAGVSSCCPGSAAARHQHTTRYIQVTTATSIKLHNSNQVLASPQKKPNAGCAASQGAALTASTCSKSRSRSTGSSRPAASSTLLKASRSPDSSRSAPLALLSLAGTAGSLATISAPALLLLATLSGAVVLAPSLSAERE